MISKIIEKLKERDYSFSELLEEFKDYELTRKDLMNYIKEIVKISKTKNWKLYYKPSVCKKCGYEIKNIKPVSKCPRCKSEWIEEVRYFIDEG